MKSGAGVYLFIYFVQVPIVWSGFGQTCWSADMLRHPKKGRSWNLTELDDVFAPLVCHFL